MAEVLAPRSTVERRAVAHSRRRRADLIIGVTALAAAMLSLPLAQSRWHGPEVAATLAVAATAMLAHQRWAIALVVLTELLLVPSIVPRAVLSHGDVFATLTGMLAILAIVPGVLAIKRASAAMVLLTGWRRTQANCRRFSAGLIASAVVAAVVPFVAG